MPAVKFRTKLGFNQHHPIMTQEQSVFSKIMTVFAAEEIILQHNVLSFPVDAYIPRYKVCIEKDEQGHNDRDNNYEIERTIEKELDCKFIRINRAKKNFNIFVEIGKIQNYIVKSSNKVTEESTKKSTIDDVKKVLKAASKFSNNGQISKSTKNFARHLLPKI